MKGKSNIKIRKAKKDEIPVISKILREAFFDSPYNERWNEESSMSRIKEYFSKNSFLYIAELNDNKKIIGFVAFRFYSWDTYIHGWIDDIAVLKEFRNKEVGSLLLKKAEKVLLKKNVKFISGLVNKELSNRKFYSESGFKEGDYVYLTKELK